jgi:hypothetical protein
MTDEQLNALMNWVAAKINSVMDSDCLGASLCERELREELKNIMMSETTYIGETKWMQVPEPLIYEHLEALVDKYHGYPMTLGRAIEKAHGIGGGE